MGTDLITIESVLLEHTAIKYCTEAARKYDVRADQKLLLKRRHLGRCELERAELIHAVVDRDVRLQPACPRQRHWSIEPGDGTVDAVVLYELAQHQRNCGVGICFGPAGRDHGPDNCESRLPVLDDQARAVRFED